MRGEKGVTGICWPVLGPEYQNGRTPPWSKVLQLFLGAAVSRGAIL